MILKQRHEELVETEYVDAAFCKPVELLNLDDFNLVSDMKVYCRFILLRLKNSMMFSLVIFETLNSSITSLPSLQGVRPECTLSQNVGASL